MATDYGVDLRALDDLPATDDLVRGADNVAYAQARRLLTPPDGLSDSGEPSAYDSLDLRQQIGAHLSDEDLNAIRADAQIALAQDERVDAPVAEVSRARGDLVVESESVAGAGPFALVVGPSGVSIELLEAT